MTEFGDLVTIAEMTPGPIAINSATFVGTQVAGLSGALIATLGCILPSCIIVTLLAKIYIQYRNVKIMQDILGTLRPVVVSMIAVAGLGILSSVFFLSGKFAPALSNFNIRGIIFFAGALLCLRKTKLSPILIMVGCGILELLYQTIFLTTKKSEANLTSLFLHSYKITLCTYGIKAICLALLIATVRAL